jgi:hypothetical protein
MAVGRYSLGADASLRPLPAQLDRFPNMYVWYQLGPAGISLARI